ncbi:MAG TPA: acyl-CoA synthetase FdrA [Coriobacteriia bacterium]|nr:acyl-CoA synthetase FdrA [Coriobacteriia bacterium]
MAVEKRVVSGLYRDSVTLMQCASRVEALPGVEKAGAMMATPANLDLARDAGLLQASESVEAGPNDLLLLVQTIDAADADAAFQEAERILTEVPKAAAGDERAEVAPRSIRMGLAAKPDASLVLVSTPGEYAASEAIKALHLGMDAMVFSDNVSVADEIEMKRLAHDAGLLLMGPDCGTAIIGGVPLGFANVVRRGDIGVIGASGTGTQQVTALIDRWGAGVTHAIGTGSHDLSADVGAVTMLDALSALEADSETKVLVLVSKPPSPEVAERVLAAASAARTPSVVCFLGADPASIERPGVTAAETLEDAAALAVELSTGEAPPGAADAADAAAAKAAADALAPSQRFIRGLYSGGTFGYEAALLLSARLGAVHSNTPARPEDAIADVWKSVGHTVIDLGDDVFTRGRPHPMIDFRLRVDRIAEEAQDPEVAVVLLDCVLGYGAHEDPAGQLVPAIVAARQSAEADGRRIAFVASVCGTEGDPQGLAGQERALRDAGVLLGRSNAHAARIAADIVASHEGSEPQ